MLASSASSKRTGSAQQGLTNCSRFWRNCHGLPILLNNPGLNKGISIIAPLATYFFSAITFYMLMYKEDVEHWHKNNKQLNHGEFVHDAGMNKAHVKKTCPLLRCRKRFVNQCVRNSMINFEVSCHARNTLFVDEKKNWKTSLLKSVFEIDKRLKSVFHTFKRKTVYG